MSPVEWIAITIAVGASIAAIVTAVDASRQAKVAHELARNLAGALTELSHLVEQTDNELSDRVDLLSRGAQ